MDIFKKIWNDPVISKVIAALIVFIGGTVYTIINNINDIIVIVLMFCPR